MSLKLSLRYSTPAALPRALPHRAGRFSLTPPLPPARPPWPCLHCIHYSSEPSLAPHSPAYILYNIVLIFFLQKKKIPPKTKNNASSLSASWPHGGTSPQPPDFSLRVPLWEEGLPTTSADWKPAPSGPQGSDLSFVNETWGGRRAWRPDAAQRPTPRVRLARAF